MSILADIYISSENDAVRYDTAREQFPDRAEYKGLTPLELSMLWSIMRGVDWDAATMNEFPCLLQIDGGERLIHRVPPAMMVQLAELSPDRIDSVTSAWAATEELNCTPEDIKPTVDDLVRLARRANETNQNVYLWNCL